MMFIARHLAVAGAASHPSAAGIALAVTAVPRLDCALPRRPAGERHLVQRSIEASVPRCADRTSRRRSVSPNSERNRDARRPANAPMSDCAMAQVTDHQRRHPHRQAEVDGDAFARSRVVAGRAGDGS